MNIEITWTASTDIAVVSYKVQSALSVDGPTEPASSAFTTIATVLIPNHSYIDPNGDEVHTWYRVRATNVYGLDSDPSAAMRKSTQTVVTLDSYLMNASTQSINYNDYSTIYCFFKGPEGTLVDVTSPTVTITKDNGDYTIVSGAALTRESTGKYSYVINFSSSAWADAGLYQVTFVGTYGTVQLRVSGQIKVGEITQRQNYISKIRLRLKDFKRKINGNMSLQYQLDSQDIFKFTEQEIDSAIDDALSVINYTGPQRMSFSVENLPYTDALTTGSVIKLIEAQAMLEIANTISDGDAKLQINRSGPLMQLASAIRDSWEKSLVSWKKASPPTPVSLGSTRLPFRLLRPLGMISGMINVFGL